MNLCRRDILIIHLAYFDDMTTHTNKSKHVLSETILKLRAIGATLEIDLQMRDDTCMTVLANLCMRAIDVHRVKTTHAHKNKPLK